MSASTKKEQSWAHGSVRTTGSKWAPRWVQ